METLFEKGWAKFESILSVEKNLGILENKIEELSCREKDVQAELSQVLNGQKLRDEVELWLKKVQRIKNEVPNIRQKVGELTWYKVRERFSLAKHVEEKIKEVDELRANGQFLNGLFVNSFPSTLNTFPLVKLVGETTALKNKEMIEGCLMDDKVGKIGICGMGGVGKTTIMTQIYNKIRDAKTFNKVIWVTVSRDLYLEKLQYDVSKALDLKLSSDHAIGRSAELFGAFNGMGRVLLILDDMWNAYPFEQVGIPEPNEENKCKIVWTTQSKKVCRGMGSHKLVEVKCLTEDESWALFQEKLGANVSPELEPIVKDVVKECDGLPLAIITVGAAMRDVRDIAEWRNALKELRNSSTEMIEGMEDDVFTCLKFSFDKLKTQRLRDCFLYCSLYPEDWEIDRKQLVEYWMADGLLDETEDRDEGFDEGYTIINHLKDACMLESGMGDCVKMHDLLRDLAINITRKLSPKFVVKTAFRVKQFSWDENLMTDAVRVSLMPSDLGKLSCQPKSCPELSTLFLKGSKLKEIHHLFFEHMQNLRVLDLSRTGIKCLPHSISNLGKLRALQLHGCSGLEEVPSLAKLKELRVLNLSGTSIESLPEGLEGLTNLRRLDLTFVRKLKTFPLGIICSLSCLEELHMFSHEAKWSSNGNEGGACVEEMLRLTNLRELFVQFADLNAFNCYVRSGHWRNLKHFCLQIGQECHGLGPSWCVRIRSISLCAISSLVLPDNIHDLEIYDLEIQSFDDMTSLSEIPSMWSLKQLEACTLGWCEKMKYILTKDQKNPFLPTLNDLYIRKLVNLRSICKDPTLTGGRSLANLKTIKIIDCPNLKYVFYVGWLQALQNLEVIEVQGFDTPMNEMEEMVVETEDMGESSNNNDNTITLPRLRILKLQNLRKLESISKRIFVCNSLEEITVDSCPKLKKLPLSINNIPPSLKSIQGSNEWWDSLEWDNSDIQTRLQLYFSSIVDMHLFSVEDEDDGTNKIDVAAHEEEEEEEKHGTKRKADALM